MRAATLSLIPLTPHCVRGALTQRLRSSSSVGMSSSSPGRLTALVTGANQGIGLECVRLLAESGRVRPILTARDETKGRAAAAALRAQLPPGAEIDFKALDIVQQSSVDDFGAWLSTAYPEGIDILINNAGMAYKGAVFGPEEARITQETNLFGTIRVCEVKGYMYGRDMCMYTTYCAP